MKFKLINLIIITFFIISLRLSNAKRRLSKVQLAVKRTDDEIHHIKPTQLGLNGKIYFLKENENKEKHTLPSHNTEKNRVQEEIEKPKKRVKKPKIIKGKQGFFKGDKSSDESDMSDDNYEKPMMRNGETAAEPDLQYDFDEPDLRIDLNK